MLKKINKYITRFILSTLVIMLFNSLMIQYNIIIPLNIFNIGLITILGLPGFVVAIIIKTML